MCGIWTSLGYLAPKTVIESVAHRGPDDSGWMEFETDSGPLVMANRRLSIHDLSDAGHQPMSYAEERYWLVYNGEIYNFVELRDELKLLGYIFRSRSDTEVVLAAYEAWGVDCLSRFNGMFAIIIWDSRDKTLFAARDRFGIKPLYYRQTRGAIAFASEIKQLTHVDDFEARLNHAKAYDFLAYGVFDHSDETLFEGILQLQGGEYVLLDLTSEGISQLLMPRTWYEFPTPGSLDLSVEDAVSRLRALLEDSVRLRLRSDVRVGACLSGGLDSSSIVCLGTTVAEGDFVTVSACYEGNEIDERPFIDTVNANQATRPAYVFPDGADFANSLENLVYHQDGPFTGPGVFAQWKVFNEARGSGVPVMLDGQGADEQLAGYHLSFGVHQAALLKRLKFPELLREMAAERRNVHTSAFLQAARLTNEVLPGWVREWTHRVRGIRRPGWLLDEFSAQAPFPFAHAQDIGGLLESQMRRTSLPMLLHYEDRNSMAFGVESRLAFLDYRVVDLLMGLGERFKIVDGETKWILRRAMSDVLPPKVLNRHDKVAFATPEREWLRGPFRETARREVEEAIDRFPSIFDAGELRQRSADMFNEKGSYAPWIWRVISFSAWGRVFSVSA